MKNNKLLLKSQERFRSNILQYNVFAKVDKIALNANNYMKNTINRSDQIKE